MPSMTILGVWIILDLPFHSDTLPLQRNYYFLLFHFVLYSIGLVDYCQIEFPDIRLSH